ncbi:MAG: beta-lactamase family protein [Gemmatimonadetes bacterium]|nr:beta-lactamase family protein [Gemmatimonadota bacterium]
MIGWRMKLAVVMLLGGAVHSTSAAQSSDAGGLQRELDILVPRLMREYRVPGASLAVILDGEVAFTRVYGVRRAGEPDAVDDGTVFQAASLTKPVVAWGAHRLVAEDRLDLDRPLYEYVDTLWVSDPRVRSITARMVLSHSTGFPNWRPDRFTASPGPLEIRFDPGTRFQYSGEGYQYLQHVMETITGESLDAYLDRAALRPLGMTESGLVWTDAFERNHASPHNGEGAAQQKWRPRVPLAAGTLQTTAADYARFMVALLGTRAPESDTGVDPDVMLTPATAIDSVLSWALGLGMDTSRGDRVFWQWGDDGPFKAMMAASRDRRRGVVVLTNGHFGLDVARAVVERVLGEQAFLRFRMISYRR